MTRILSSLSLFFVSVNETAAIAIVVIIIIIVNIACLHLKLSSNTWHACDVFKYVADVFLELVSLCFCYSEDIHGQIN